MFGFLAGVRGDNGNSDTNLNTTGVIGAADEGYAGFFVNHSQYFSTLSAGAFGSGPSFDVFNYSTGLGCNIDSSANLNCDGTKNAIVPLDGGARRVAVSAIESPQNWFEDFGSGHLVNGSAVVPLDSDFAQTVNAALEYHVFLTPNGDCKGLYISQRTRSSFEVHELSGGTSGIEFSYRVVALRKKYESVRFADHTNDPDPRKMMERMKGARPAKMIR